MTYTETATEICRILDNKKAVDIKALRIGKLTSLADCFIICTGVATPHVNTLVGAVEEEMKKKFGVEPLHVEGYQAGNWVLMDYGDVVVHIFLDETRKFYSLERVWADAEIIDIDYGENGGNEQ